VALVVVVLEQRLALVAPELPIPAAVVVVALALAMVLAVLEVLVL
jgi:hypothetical protein